MKEIISLQKKADEMKNSKAGGVGSDASDVESMIERLLLARTFGCLMKTVKVLSVFVKHFAHCVPIA